MILYGASGHAKVICSVLERLQVNVVGIFDDNIALKTMNKYHVLGAYDPQTFPGEAMIISIGDNSIRYNLTKKISHSFGSCIATTAICDDTVRISEGTVVLQGAILQRDVTIGAHCIINTSASIDHDCVIGDFVHISPGATLCGSVKVGDGTQIGANATVIPNIHIGKWCVIGAGAVVIRNVPDFSVVMGVPGNIVKKLA